MIPSIREIERKIFETHGFISDSELPLLIPLENPTISSIISLKK